MIRKLFFIGSVAIIVLMSLSFAYSDVYKYIDENGVVSYTDDLSNVPGGAEKAVEKIDEIVTEEPLQTEVKEDKDVVSEKDPALTTRESLELMKIDLDKEYNSCKAEQDMLIEEKSKVVTNIEQVDFNEKAKALQARIEAYTKKNEDYQKMIADFNKSITN